ncbi:DUF4230 domain-containing protein [Paucisalibacillus globulus]|uniref:DUF4230 domain-containing protein n=1 Tax=Paucisalibacillus globulus TaxID=351095 RepID=UPI0004296B51|nr:DUF4230 domain-containing protein [Paucisalibacillus globulus]
MNKKDNALKEMENIIAELKSGREESAATAVMGQKKEKRHISGTIFKLFFKYWGIKILLIVLLLIAVTAGSIWAFSGSTFKKETTTFVEQVQELATLATAEAHLKVVIEQEDNKIFGQDISVNFPGTKREVLLIVPVAVTAGVNLKEVDSTDIKMNEKNNEIDITLPKAALVQEPAIQMENVRAFSDEGLFRGDVKWVEGFDLAAEAQMKAKEESIEIGLLESAEQNASKVLEEFFTSLGYSANITFK